LSPPTPPDAHGLKPMISYVKVGAARGLDGGSKEHQGGDCGVMRAADCDKVKDHDRR
jgi:hypothetical protein